jgi:type II secretory pathway predicted ATPase ExeA
VRKQTLKAFSLSHDPFSKEFSDDEVWLPPSKSQVVETITEALRARQHILIIGEPGTGKTVALRGVRHALPKTRFRLTYCHNATLGRRDFYRQLCLAIGLSPKATAAAVFSALTEYVEDLAADKQVHPVFIMDESHLMKDEMLDHLHILTNYAWDSRALLSLVLVGLPELHERLGRRRHRSLMSRIHCRVVINPLAPSDTHDYIRHRLTAAGCKAEPFPPDAIALLHEKTGGLMRDLDRIAALALDLAARKKSTIVHKDIALTAIALDANGEVC